MYYPTFEQFKTLAADHSLVPVYRELLSDTLTPVSAFLKLDPSSDGFLLESVVGGEKIARYSFLASRPTVTFTARSQECTLSDADGVRRFQSEDPLRELGELVSSLRAARVDGLPRFCGGLVGFVAYDAVRYIEHLPDTPPDDRGLADLHFGLYDSMVIFDHINKTVKVVAHARTDDRHKKAYHDAIERIDAIVEKLRAPSELPTDDVYQVGDTAREFDSNFTCDDFLAAVRKCKEYILAGDILQVVLSQRLARRTHAEPFTIYRALRAVNPSPYMFFLRFDQSSLVGASPEVMVRLEGDEVTVRPIAGTRPRGANEEEDAALAEELLADPKECAEHVMLIDLGRNDVGRVCQPKTVRVDERMIIERYSHVMHIVSNVVGKIRPSLGAIDVLEAGLPAGTVSGAPKIRAMQIIDELEPTKRGPYAGAVGYIDFSGNMDTCITIRTIVITDGVAYAQAGAGIVADSVPEREYEETLHKSRALLKAISMAERMSSA